MRGLVVCLTVLALVVIWGFYAQAAGMAGEYVAALAAQPGAALVSSILGSLGLPDPNAALTDAALAGLAGVKAASIIGTVGILVVAAVALLAGAPAPARGPGMGMTWGEGVRR